MDNGFIITGYRPLHGVGIRRQPNDSTSIRVALFGSIAADVHFTNISVPIQGSYQTDLTTGEQYGQFNRVDARPLAGA